MKPFGIEKQTLLVALIPIMLMALLLESYVIYSRFNDLDTSMEERSQLLASQLASSSEYAVFSNNLELLRQDIDAVLAQQDMSRVAILDASANLIIGATREGQGRYESLLEKSDLSDKVYEDDDVLILHKPIFPTRIKLDEFDFQGGMPLAKTKPLGTIIVEISKHRLHKQKREILILSLALTLLVVSVSIFMAIVAARRITRPVMEMSQVLHSFGNGNLDSRIKAQSRVPELNELSVGFNQMAQKLQQSQEILENKVAERTMALAASELEYRTLIENTPDTIARYDRNCRRTFVNHAFASLAEGGSATLLGTSPTESPGGPNSELYELKIKEVFATGKAELFELKWTGKEGAEICSYIRLTPEHDLSGNIISVMGVGHDISDLNESKNELQRKELAKSRFLAAAGHDLRQPLAAANLFIDALKFTEPSAKQNTIIGQLDQSMANFNGLLEALLDVSKLDGGMIKPEYSIVQVADIFDWIEQSFAPAANKKQIRFLLHYPKKESLAVRVDLGLLNSVLMNLITNATKFTSKGGIMVSARRRGGNLLFQVWDTGVGISEEHCKLIFDEFYQVNNPQRDRTKGLGLGLYIAKRSLELFDGTITCHSKVGRGTVFEFHLPLAGTISEVAPPRDTKSAFDDAANIAFVQGKSFVVIEDDQLVADALSGVLLAMGAKVETYFNAEEALGYIHTKHVDYYIVDHMLGGKLTGIQFLNEIRQKLNTPVKAVIVSGDTSLAFVLQIEKCDWTVLHKPVNVTKLIEVLARA